MDVFGNSSGGRGGRWKLLVGSPGSSCLVVPWELWGFHRKSLGCSGDIVNKWGRGPGAAEPCGRGAPAPCGRRLQGCRAAGRHGREATKPLALGLWGCGAAGCGSRGAGAVGQFKPWVTRATEPSSRGAVRPEPPAGNGQWRSSRAVRKYLICRDITSSFALALVLSDVYILCAHCMTQHGVNETPLPSAGWVY